MLKFLWRHHWWIHCYCNKRSFARVFCNLAFSSMLSFRKVPFNFFVYSGLLLTRYFIRQENKSFKLINYESWFFYFHYTANDIIQWLKVPNTFTILLIIYLFSVNPLTRYFANMKWMKVIRNYSLIIKGIIITLYFF